MILLDTHAWVWLASEPESLSASAAAAIAGASAVGVSPISAWEVAMLAAKRRIRLSMDAGDWVEAALASTRARIVSLTPQAAVLAVGLRAELNRDPADCLIVATAIAEGIPVVSKDERIRRFPGVGVIW